MQELYEIGYRDLSSLEHSDAMAFLGLIQGGPGGLRIKLWSDQMIPDYMGMGLSNFAYLFRAWNDELRVIESANIDEAIDAARELLRPEFRPPKKD
jgi:hypothetical protein